MNKKHYIIPIFVPHLACPHRCSFCDQHAISGAASQPEPAAVKEIVNTYLQTIPSEAIKEIAFFGGSFTGLPKARQQQFLQEANVYLRTGAINGIRISTRPDYIDEDIIQVLKDYAVGTVELGVQSFDSQVLTLSGRGHTSQHSMEAFRMLRDNGFQVGIQLMPGLPGSTESSDFTSVSKTVLIHPDFCRLYPTVVLKNTTLASMQADIGYRPLTLETAINFSKRAVVLLKANDIPVIRVGLHPSPGLEAEVVAGPYHQALGHLVETRIYYDMAKMLLKRQNLCQGDMVRLLVSTQALSAMIGYRRINQIRLEHEYSGIGLEIKPDRDSSGDGVSILVNGTNKGELDMKTLLIEEYGLSLP
ncbi:radical SAM protein [Metallumcola ferriviriculae]|uniref:Radical SAM protein n=1 Tax=Metallumcola ferriviriculae TaxID=3039180 RepID=A0AAU0UPT5_9FIRM|nr:radical SAM protein [Desulfitibacteraceae bacterium MK1]